MACALDEDFDQIQRDVSPEPTTDQPRPAPLQIRRMRAFARLSPRKVLEARAQAEGGGSSWCQAVLCGRRKSKKVVTQFVENNRSTELQNSECAKMIEDLNTTLAIFRDCLVHVTKPQDGPEIRDKIKETRKKCLDLCISANEIIMPQIRSDIADGILVDNQQLVNLFCCTQLLLRELKKCHNLVFNNPMDMTAFYERKPRASGVSVLDKLILFKLPPRDYHREELQNITKDIDEAGRLLKEMKDFMPCESNDKIFMDENVLKWSRRERRSLCQFADDWICNCGTNLA